MKGMSPLISSVLLIVITIGIGTVLYTLFIQQATEPLAESKEQSFGTVDCASAHFHILSSALVGNDLIITAQNTGLKDLVAFQGYADNEKGLQAFGLTLLNSAAKGSVFRLENATFPYTFSNNITVVSTTCPSVKTEINLRDPSLVGYWKFENDVLDYSGTKNIGTLMNGPVYSSGVRGSAITLDGVNDYVEIPHSSSLQFSTAFTITGWFLLANQSAPSSYWVLGTKGTYQTHGWDAFFTNGNATHKIISIRMNDASKTPSNTSSVSSNPVELSSSWKYVAITVNFTDVNQTKIYLNGEVIAAGNFSSGYNAVVSNTQTVRLGSEGGRFTNGSFDEIRFYNRALTQEEVRALYESQK